MIGRLTLTAEQIRAGDWLISGDECFPRSDRVRCVARLPQGIDLTFDDGETRLLGLGQRVLVEREVVELPSAVALFQRHAEVTGRHEALTKPRRR